MPTSMPIGLIAKAIAWLWSQLTKLLLFNTYVRSQEIWARRNRLGARWQPLGNYLEYSLRLALLTDIEPRTSRVALRATSRKISSLEVYFEATGSGIRYQEKISLCDLNSRPIIWNLVNIPCQRLIDISESGAAFSIDSVQFLHCHVELDDGEVIPRHNSLMAHMTHSWLMNDEWAFRWGVWWNCNSIKWAKRRIEEYWRWGVGSPAFRIYSSNHREPIWISGLRGIGWVMGRSWLVTLQFWMAIWSGLFILNDDDRLQWRWSQQIKPEEQEAT